MILEDLVFDSNKILTLNNSIEELCLCCAGIGIFCNGCPVNETKNALYSLAVKNNENSFPIPKEFQRLIGEDLNLSFSDLIFDKNKLLIAQNAVEDLCFNCAGTGILCSDCTVHQARRTLASLPV